MRLMTPPLPAASRSSKMTHLEMVVPHILLQFDQFDLEVYEFLDVVVILRGFVCFGSVTYDPVLLDFYGLPR